MNQVLARQIHPGDSQKAVELALGEGETVGSEMHAKYVDAIRNWQHEDPELYPDGAEQSDVFVVWPVPGCNQMLQFRDDRLINHSPDSYLATVEAR